MVKLDRVLKESELSGIVGPGDKVFVKCHMGAPLTTRYLRPIYVRRIVDRVKSLGGKPTVIETTGLGLLDPRGTAAKYMKVGASHGFTEEVLGAPIVIADGELGLDSMDVRVGGARGWDVPVAGMLSEADALISAAHFKGHISVGFGGAMKNVGVGLVSKKGKFMFHYKEMPKVNEGGCNGCGHCLEVCPVKGAVKMRGDKAAIDAELCVGCLACVARCEPRAIVVKRREDPTELQLRLADMVAAVMSVVGKENALFVNFLLEVDWQCDCEHFQEGWSDVPIVPDLGIVASKDPVAADAASMDLINRAPGMSGSRAEEVGALGAGTDKFAAIYPKIGWRVALRACEELGVGSTAYEVVQVG